MVKNPILFDFKIYIYDFIPGIKVEFGVSII
jgi:hypothetical protein